MRRTDGRLPRARAGLVLLEVLVALAILGMVAGSLATLAVGSSDAVHRAERADDEMRRASAFLDAVALWPHDDLDRHLGRRPEGPWLLEIQRPAPALYTVSLSDSSDAERELLHTALFRPVPRAGALVSDAR